MLIILKQLFDHNGNVYKVGETVSENRFKPNYIDRILASGHAEQEGGSIVPVKRPSVPSVDSVKPRNAKKYAFTSISPKHAMAHAQPFAVETWIEAGFKVLSFNGMGEIDQLKDQYPNVEFVPCRTADGLFKRPYVPISAFIDYAKSKDIEQVMIINSDIVLKDGHGDINKYLDWCDNGLVIANREDHEGAFDNGVRYMHGFDVFVVHSKHYGLIPQTLFCMGQTWWDYWLPFRFIKNKVPVTCVKEPIFYHQSHDVQYDSIEWSRMTKHFQWVEGYSDGNPQKTTAEVYKFIRQNLI